MASRSLAERALDVDTSRMTCPANGLPADEHLAARARQAADRRGVPDAGRRRVSPATSILEVSTSCARSANEREAMLAESLHFARTHLLR